jgi:WD40-like Beta Propeller Repeat
MLLLLAARAEAQADPSGSWRTLHTPHFRIHFRPAYREVALREAREAERSYGLLATELRPPRGVVDLTLADDVDAANGFTTVVPTSRITINAAPPAGDHGLLLFDDWLRLVTTHELAHVFHLDRTRGLWSGLQWVFGRAPGLFPNEYQPSWMIEGLATYYESRFTNGGRVRGSFHTQLLAADRVAGASRSPWNALLFTRWADGTVPYAYGSRFLHYLAGVTGDSVVPRLVEATSAQLIPFRVGRQVSRVAPGHSLTGDWAPGTRPPPGSGSPPPAARTLDSLLRNAPLPRVSPDGRRVAYLRDDGKGAAELRVLDAATLRPLARHRVNAGVDFDWLGDTLVVTQLDFTSRWRIRSDLYRWVAGRDWRRATHDARLVAPAGGGGRLAAIALATGSARPTIPTPATPAGAVWEDITTSPDGRWVAGSRVAAGRRALVLWRADSLAAAAVLFETRGTVADVVWTADGDLWFVADPTGFPQVYRWSDSATAVPLTAEPLGARSPAPLGDGSLLYAGLSAGGWELRRAPAVTAGAPVAFAAPLPFEPAPPPVPVHETGYTSWPSLRPHFWIPVFQDEGPTGRFGGALTAGTDAIGRVAYAAAVFVSPRPFRAAADFVLVAQALGNPAFDLSAATSWADLAPQRGDPTRTLSELDQTAALGASFVGRGWRRFASVRIAAELERTRFATIPDTSLAGACPGCDPQRLYGGSATLTLSRVVTAPLSVSAEDGVAWSATYRRRQEEGTTRWSNEVRSRLALYARVPGLGGFAHHVVALRVLAGASNGPLGTLFRVGGVAPQGVTVFFAPSLSATRAFPLRGYSSAVLRGERAVAASIEYRAPLALVGRALGHLPLGVDRLWLNLFADAGDAWAPGASPRLARLRSTGVEFAGRVAVSYDFPLSVRVGIAEPLAAPPSGAARRPQVYAALASDF